jgi:hypothetical protein
MIKKAIASCVLILLSGFSMAQQTASKSKTKQMADEAWARAGCGADGIHFDVSMDKNQHVLAEPESGKAMVYVFEDDESRTGFPTTRVGVDGKWIGGNVPESYMFFSVTPGVHRLCSNWQGQSKLGAALDFTAEAGKIYFFDAKMRSFGSYYFRIDQVPEAEGHFLIASHGVSKSSEKNTED